MLASEAFVHLLTDVLAQEAAWKRLALIEVRIVRERGPEMHQFQGQFIMILQRMNQRARIDAKGVHLPQHQAEEFDIAHQQGVLVGGSGDEGVGEIRFFF